MGLVILCRRSTSGCPRVGLGVNGSMEIASPDHCRRSASLPVERMFRGFTVRGCSETMAGGTVAEGT